MCIVQFVPLRQLAAQYTNNFEIIHHFLFEVNIHCGIDEKMIGYQLNLRFPIYVDIHLYMCLGR